MGLHPHLHCNKHLRTPTIEEGLHVRVVPVRDKLRGRVQGPEDLDAHAVSVVLGEAGLGTCGRAK